MFDLPWTNLEDYEEFLKFFQWFTLPKGGKITVKFTGFLPQPGTPMQDAPKSLRIEEYIFLDRLVRGGKTKRETLRPGLSGTSINIIPIQKLDNQAIDLYFIRSGMEMFSVVEKMKGRTIGLGDFRKILKAHSVELDELLSGKTLGRQVEPVAEWKKQISFDSTNWDK
jgi:hypothetical protein